MRIFHSLQEAQSYSNPSYSKILSPSAFCLGTFDGIHAGHRVVMESALRFGQQHHLTTGVFTFSNHPQHVLTKTPPRLLSTFDDRLATFEAMGFDMVVCPPFDDALKNIKASLFIEDILKNTLNAKALSVGYDFCFGQNRQGNGQFLQDNGPQYGIEHIHIIEPVKVHEQIVSSTLIRKLLTYGELEQAVHLLGYPYPLSAKVIQGKQLGRQLGFPTANLDMDTLKQQHRLIPANGVYGGYGQLNNKTYRITVNIGHAPSVDGGTPTPRIEAHILDYNQSDFYGETLTIHLTHQLRKEKTFDSLEALKTQIQADCDQARLLIPLPQQNINHPLNNVLTLSQ